MIHELNNYIEPVNNKFSGSQFTSKYFLGGELMPVSEIGKANCALIGISETRNALEGEYLCNTDKIREQLYKLSSNGLPKRIIDLGNLISGKTINDTYSAISFITQTLIEKNIIPVFFGGTSDVSYPIIKALSDNKDIVNTTIIDSSIDIGSNNELHSHSYIRKTKELYPNTHFSILGYQSYFVTESDIDFSDISAFDLIRLGQIRSSFNSIEPILRDTDFCAIDLNAIRSADCSAINYPGPNGLYADEICRISYLSGMSDNIFVFHIAEYNGDKDTHNQTAMLSAQIVWYFLFGMNQRENDYPTRSIDTYNKLYVKIEKPDIEILFYKNEQNNRYWMELPLTNKKMVISCSESDYRSICNQNFPDRIWKKIQHNF